MINKKYRVKASIQNVSGVIEFVEKCLKEDKKCDSKKIMKTLLLCEETLIQLIDKSNKECDVLISVSIGRNKNTVSISCKGEKFKISDSTTISEITEYDGNSEDEASVISSLILKSLSSDISLRHTNGYNKAKIKLDKQKGKESSKTLVCLIMGLVCGFIFRAFLPYEIGDFINTNLLSVVSDIFMNGIKMIVTPLVFFSIAESALSFSDVKTFGRVGAKVMISYIGTTVVAILIAYAIFFVIKPGDPSIMPMVNKMIDLEYSATSVPSSISQMIVGFIPSNLLGAFVNGDMMQVIVIAIVIGIATNMIGEAGEAVKGFVGAGSALFIKITGIIVLVLPPAIFAMMFSFAFYLDLSAMVQMLYAYLVFLISIVLMMLFYSALLLFVGKVNPIKFFKAYLKAMIVAFSTCSSSVSMPTTMKCLDEMGISPKIYSFSIPLGTTINMDGASISFSIMVLFCARIFGITLTPGMLLSLAISTIIMSMGTPCVVGSAYAFIATLLSQVGIPMGVVAFLVPLNCIMEFIDTVSNVTGDAAVTTAVARSEGLIDDNKYFLAK